MTSTTTTLKSRATARLTKLQELSTKKFASHTHPRERFSLFPGADVTISSSTENREINEYLLTQELVAVTTAFVASIKHFGRDVDRNEASPLQPQEVQTYISPVLDVLVGAAVRASQTKNKESSNQTSNKNDSSGSNNKTSQSGGNDNQTTTAAISETEDGEPPVALWSELVPKLSSLLFSGWFFGKDSHPQIRRSAARIALFLNAMSLSMETDIPNGAVEDISAATIISAAIDWEALTGELNSSSQQTGEISAFASATSNNNSAEDNFPASSSGQEMTSSSSNITEPASPIRGRDPFGAVAKSTIPHSKAQSDAQGALKDILSPVSHVPSFLASYIRAVQCALFNTIIYPKLYERRASLPPAQVHAVIVLHFLKPLLMQWSTEFNSSSTSLWIPDSKIARVLCTSALCTPVSDGARLATPNTSTSCLRILARNREFIDSVIRAILWLVQTLETETPHQCKSLSYGLEETLTTHIGPDAALVLRHGQSWCELFLEVIDGKLGTNPSSSTSSSTSTTSMKQNININNSSSPLTPRPGASSSNLPPPPSPCHSPSSPPNIHSKPLVGSEDAKKIVWVLGFFATNCARICSKKLQTNKPLALPSFMGAAEKFWTGVFTIAPPVGNDFESFSSFAVPVISEIQHHLGSLRSEPHLSTSFVEMLASFISNSATMCYHIQQQQQQVAATTTSDPSSAFLSSSNTTNISSSASPSSPSSPATTTSNINNPATGISGNGWPHFPFSEDARIFLNNPWSQASLLYPSKNRISAIATTLSPESAKNIQPSKIFCALVKWLDTVLSKPVSSSTSNLDNLSTTTLLRSVCESCLNALLGPKRKRVNPVSLSQTTWQCLVRGITTSNSSKVAFLAAEAIASLLNHSVNVYHHHNQSNDNLVDDLQPDVARNLVFALIHYLDIGITSSSSLSTTPASSSLTVSPATTSLQQQQQSSTSSNTINVAKQITILRILNRLFSASDGFTCIAEQPRTEANAELLKAVISAAPNLMKLSSADYATSPEFKNMSSAILALSWQWHFQPTTTNSSSSSTQNQSSSSLTLLSLSTVTENITKMCDRPMESRSVSDWQHICGYLTNIVLDHASITKSDDGIKLCGIALDQLCRIAVNSESSVLSSHLANSFRLIMDGFALTGLSELFRSLMRYIVSVMSALLLRQLPVCTTNNEALPRCFFALTTLLHAVLFRCANSWSSFSMIIELTRFCRRERVHSYYTTRRVGSVEVLVLLDPKKGEELLANQFNNSTQQQQQQQSNENVSEGAADGSQQTSSSPNDNQQQQQQQSSSKRKVHIEVVLSPLSPPWHGNAEDDTDADEEDIDEAAGPTPLLPSSGGGNSASSSSNLTSGFPTSSSGSPTMSTTQVGGTTSQHQQQQMPAPYSSSPFSSSQTNAHFLNASSQALLDYEESRFERRIRSMARLLCSLCMTSTSIPNAPPALESTTTSNNNNKSNKDFASVSMWDIHSGRAIGCTRQEQQQEEEEKDDLDSDNENVIENENNNNPFLKYVTVDDTGSIEWKVSPILIANEKNKKLQKEREEFYKINEIFLRETVGDIIENKTSQNNAITTRKEEEEEEEEIISVPNINALLSLQQDEMLNVRGDDDDEDENSSEEDNDDDEDEDEDDLFSPTSQQHKTSSSKKNKKNKEEEGLVSNDSIFGQQHHHHRDPLAALIDQGKKESSTNRQADLALLESVSSFSISSSSNSNSSSLNARVRHQQRMKEIQQYEQKRQDEKSQKEEEKDEDDDEQEEDISNKFNWSAILLESMNCLSPSEQHRRLMPWRTSALRVLPGGMEQNSQEEESLYKKLRAIPTHRHKYRITLVAATTTSSDQSQSTENNNKSLTTAKLLLHQIVHTPKLGGTCVEISSNGLHGLRRTATEEFHCHIVEGASNCYHTFGEETSSMFTGGDLPCFILFCCNNHRDMYELAAGAADQLALIQQQHQASRPTTSSSSSSSSSLIHRLLSCIPLIFLIPTRSENVVEPVVDAKQKLEEQETNTIISSSTFVPHVKRSSSATSIFPFFDGAPIRGLPRLAMTIRSAVLVSATETGDSYRHRRHKMRMETGVALLTIPRASKVTPAIAAAIKVNPFSTTIKKKSKENNVADAHDHLDI